MTPDIRSLPVKTETRGKDAIRLEMLKKLGVMEPGDNRDFDTLTKLAHRKLGGAGCAITFVDECNQWARSSCGVAPPTVPRAESFCARGIASEEMLIVEDAKEDPRFAENALVTGPPYLRFYAGVPLRAGTQGTATKPVVVGMLCLYGGEKRRLTDEELEDLKDFAVIAEMLLELRFAYSEAQRSREENEETIRLLHREQRQFKQAERMANIGSWRLTFADSDIEWSDQVFTIHELPTGAPPPLESALTFYPEDVRDTILQSIALTVETGEAFEFETDFITAKNRHRRVRSKGELEMVSGKPVALIGVFQDITAQYEMQQALRVTAITDELTQLPNRAECNRVVDEKIAEARRAGRPFALMLLDLDGFKKVNDVCGHHKGDELLRSVSLKLRAPYLSECFAARLGGDEFVVAVSSSADCQNLDGIVERLLSDLRETVTCDGVTIPVSGTIGVCWLRDGIEGRSELMKNADKALYIAKNKLRGTAYVYDEGQET